MYIQQLSLFVQNTPGRLKHTIDLLSKNHIDIRALSISDTSAFGIMRLIVAEPQRAAETLRAADCMVQLTDVLAIEIDDSPGGLASTVDALAENNINIEYMYAFVSRHTNTAYAIIRVEDNDHAVDVLRERGIRPATPEEIYDM